MKKHKKKMTWLEAAGLGVLGVFGLSLCITMLLQGTQIPLMSPKGFISGEQHSLMVVSTLIMVGFAALVLAALYFFAWKYRETNDKAEFNAAAGRSKKLLALAWGSPILVFILLASIMLPATQRLEPQRSIASTEDQITIRVIAMRWKWVFLYPDHDVATVNFVQIPVDTPIRFELSADEAPMNSFWIPHLGGMLYAMTEHVNPLNLMATEVGDYNGGAAEINGRGFAGMRFTTRVSSEKDFEEWIERAAQSPDELDAAAYDKLLEPSENNQVAIYHSPTNQEIFSDMLKKYAGGSHSHYKLPENTGHEGH